MSASSHGESISELSSSPVHCFIPAVYSHKRLPELQLHIHEQEAVEMLVLTCSENAVFEQEALKMPHA